MRDRRGGGGALLSRGCSSTGLGLLSVPLDLVAFPVGMMLVFVLPRHDDTGQEPQAGVQLGRQATRAPGGRTKKCEHLHQGESSQLKKVCFLGGLEATALGPTSLLFS